MGPLPLQRGSSPMLYCISCLLIFAVFIAIVNSFSALRIAKVMLEQTKNCDVSGSYRSAVDNINSRVRSKWIVLLTASVNRTSVESTNLHSDLYAKQLGRWLNETQLPIYFVDASGVGIPQLRGKFRNFTTILGNQLAWDDRMKGSSSSMEACSLLIALRALQLEKSFLSATHVLKVTGRYFLEGVEEVIDDLDPNKDLFVQRHFNDKIKWQNSEYFGIKKEFVMDISNEILFKGTLMEHALYSIRERLRWDFFGEGFPNTQPRGGDGLVINPL